MKVPSFVRNWIWKRLGKTAIDIGTRTYIRWRYFPAILAFKSHHEDWLDEIYTCIFALRDGAVIDVGVNRGQTFFKLLRMDPQRRYIGFEPQTAPSFMIEHFLAENRLANHTVIPVGLSNEYNLLPIRVRGSGYEAMFSSGASMVDKFRPDNFYDFSKFIVVAPGDAIIPKLKIDSLAMIKIDVEGAELEVIQGLAQTIQDFRPYILFEVLHHFLATTGEELSAEIIAFRESRVAALETALRSRSYSIYNIAAKDEVRKVERIEPKVIDDLSSTDYMAVPTEQEKRFVADMRSFRRVQD